MALAPGAELLIAARVVQGLGAAVLFPASLSLIGGRFPHGPEGHRAMALWGVAGASEALVGPLAGGVLNGLFGWQSVLLVNVPLVTAALIGAVRLLPADLPRPTPGNFDIPGALIVTAGSSLIVFGRCFRSTCSGASVPGRPTRPSSPRWGPGWHPVSRASRRRSRPPRGRSAARSGLPLVAVANAVTGPGPLDGGGPSKPDILAGLRPGVLVAGIGTIAAAFLPLGLRKPQKPTYVPRGEESQQNGQVGQSESVPIISY